ncbi:hypothetical protein CC2G_004279 [Coprinopsis cinerea AmutBmut pab1-1]|nr:hypothetical protein CC2G_004279 [Coprinopsis cinerea AmutBmut pab1-1]
MIMVSSALTTVNAAAVSLDALDVPDSLIHGQPDVNALTAATMEGPTPDEDNILVPRTPKPQCRRLFCI